MADSVHRRMLLLEVAVAALILATGILPSWVSVAFDPPALLLGGCTGVLLFALLAGSEARLGLNRDRLAFLGFGIGLTAIAAAKEEVIFRGVLMAVFAEAYSAIPALVFSAAIFAGAHDHQGAEGVQVHFLTGLAFGGVMALTWNLPAAILAHTVYNGCILLASEARRTQAAGLPA
jgi:membrane protease YdiL (CAAX protease family)